MGSTLSLFCLAIVVVSVLGGAIPLWIRVTHTRMQMYLSLAAGLMLGATFFHMLPEAVELSPGVLPWVVPGFVLLFLLERYFSYHHHEPLELDGGTTEGPTVPAPEVHRHDSHGHDHDGHGGNGSKLNWWAASIGLAVHSILGGLALATAVAVDFSRRGAVGPATWGVFLATLIHKPADALTVVSLMIRAGVRPWLTHLANFAFSMMIPVGVLTFFLGLGRLPETQVAGMTAGFLAFSAGTFLCIALTDLLPELHFHSHDRTKLSVALMVGLALMWLTMGQHGGHSHTHEPEFEGHLEHAEPASDDTAG